MGSDSVKLHAAKGRTDTFLFDPETLVLVTDESSAVYDERVHIPTDEALVLNIMVNGVLENILVRTNGQRDGHSVVEVIDGRQRVKAAREANKRLAEAGKATIRVPANLKKGEPVDMAGIMISANEIRKADDQRIRARKLQRYINMGRTEEEAAVQFGVNVQTVKNLLSYLDLNPEVQRDIEKMGLPASTIGKELSKIPQEEQPAALAALVASGNIRGARGVQAVKNIRKGKGATSVHVKVPAKAQARVEKALTNGESENLKKPLEKIVADAAAATIAWVNGDKNAFKRWPKVQEIIDTAAAKPVKPSKPKKEKKERKGKKGKSEEKQA
jgi:ParB family chromosome partitioning protein